MIRIVDYDLVYDERVEKVVAVKMLESDRYLYLVDSLINTH